MMTGEIELDSGCPEGCGANSVCEGVSGQCVCLPGWQEPLCTTGKVKLWCKRAQYTKSPSS